MKSYPCICRGECSPHIEGLASCIMLTDKENSYCRWCKRNMSRKDKVAYEDNTL